MQKTRFCEQVGVEVPIICGAMYPCTGPELVAATSEAGAIGIIQPMSFEYVHKIPLRDGIRMIRERTRKPIGLNLIVEKSVKSYEERSKRWLDTALEEGVRFFITALGNPQWVTERAHAQGGTVYHDVTARKWALKAMEADVDGFICVNRLAGGHAGDKTPQELWDELHDLGKPLICAGGVGDEKEFLAMLKIGYAGVQMGTRFIATEECRAHSDYKAAIVKAAAADIVLSEKITGVPVAVINTPYIEKMGLKAGPIGRFLLRHPKTKHWMRTFYAVKSLHQLKNSFKKGGSYQDYWQAGKSVENIAAIEPAGRIVERFAASMQQA